MASDKLVLGVAGMPGSGKSLVVRVAKDKGYGCVVMGDVVRGEAETLKIEPNAENIGRIMLELREKHGKNVVAKRCIFKIEECEEGKVIVDGIRSLDEVEEFKKRFSKFSLIAILSSPETRFQRLYKRRRSDDVKTWDVFHERDMRELGVGIGNVIAMAEYMIVNESTSEVARSRVKYVLRRVENKWKK